MATDSDRSPTSDLWTPEAVAERTAEYFRHTLGLKPNQFLTETVALARIVEVDSETGAVLGTRVVRVYPGGPVPGDVERMILTEAHADALAERHLRA